MTSVKRSLSIKGHRTSVALEAPFWRILDDVAARRAISLPALVSEIDQSRLRREPAPGLASALRVFALEVATREADRRGAQSD
ncbi:MAG: ribbon-helix-helix domain-containing protein [Pseudomonadota bacterium]